jgi:F420-non-reducing hydrogenase large subunit
MVDSNGKVNFYDGRIRAVSPEGKEIAMFDPQNYLDHITERVEEWSYIKFPYLKNVGWKGFVDGTDSGIYRVNSLARLNVADGMATPLAQEAYERFYDYFGQKPVHNILAYHWARLIEIMYSAERVLELAVDEEITDRDVKVDLGKADGEGVGVVEAPRGTLYHHYITDRNGVTQKVNLIVATVQNNAAINLSVKKVAQNLIKNGKADEKLLNMVEMAVRAYDPCLACASHSLPLNVKLHRI